MLDFIITGPARSGTTALAHIMNRDPNIICGHELDILTNWDEYIMGVEAHKVRMIKDVLRPDYPMCDDMKLRGVDFDNFYRRVLYAKNGEEIANALSDADSAKLVGDKHPDYLFFIQHHMRNYPDVKIVMCIRDGREILASHMRGENLTNAKLTVEESELFIKLYIRNIGIAENVHGTDTSERMHIVKYEDALLDEAGVINGLSEYLGHQIPLDDLGFYKRRHTLDEALTILPDNYRDLVSPAFIEYQNMFGYPV